MYKGTLAIKTFLELKSHTSQGHLYLATLAIKTFLELNSHTLKCGLLSPSLQDKLTLV
jgi:hypothetical protein